MATSYAPVSISGGSHLRKLEGRSTRAGFLGGKAPPLTVSMRPLRSPAPRTLSVSARYNDGDRHDAGEFFAGFLLGGAIFGTLAYIYAPQIRRAVLNEDEHGFRRVKAPPYYFDDDGLGNTRRTLNEKLNQLNNAIDKVSQRLRGGSKKGPTPDPADVRPPIPEYDAGGF